MCERADSARDHRIRARKYGVSSPYRLVVNIICTRGWCEFRARNLVDRTGPVEPRVLSVIQGVRSAGRFLQHVVKNRKCPSGVSGGCKWYTLPS